MPKKLLKQYWPILAITAVVFIFFSKLFFPPSLFVTPDYGRSDILHFNIPIKEILSESLKKGQLPLWESRIGQGFPVFDEGQIGALFLPNIVLFGLLPFWLAFNLGYVVTFLTAALGTYLLARSFNLSKLSSFLAAVTFAFSAGFVPHIQHYNMIQTGSLMPWLFWLVNEFFKTKRLIFLAFLPIFISQQIFTGFPQITFYSLFGLLIFFAYKLRLPKTTNAVKIQIALILCAFIILGFLIAAVQLNSTYNITQSSKRIDHNDPAKILTDFPLKPKNLLTAINPYILGSPQNATYSRWEPGKWSVYWESNLYFGIIQLFLFLATILIILAKKNWEYRSKAIFWLTFGMLGLLLALGVSAPLYPIFTFPIFSYFRVPARFLIFTFLAASILSAMTIEFLAKKRQNAVKLLALLVVIFAVSDIFRTWSRYHATGETKKWITPPEVQNLVPNGRIHSIGMYLEWNRVFLTEGWESKESMEKFNFLLNFMGQNSNITYGKEQLLAYAGMSPNRQIIKEGLLNSKIDLKDNKIEIGKLSSNILNVTSTEFITSPFLINSTDFELKSNLSDNGQNIFLYKNLKNLPHVYSVGDYKVANTVQAMREILSDESFGPQKTVILEKTPKDKVSTNGKDTAQITEYTNTKVKVAASLSSTSIIVLSDSYYPGWTATIDKIPTEIMAANINSRAVIVPQGDHTIEYNYLPENFKKSVIISISAFLVSIFLLGKMRKSTFSV